MDYTPSSNALRAALCGISDTLSCPAKGFARHSTGLGRCRRRYFAVLPQLIALREVVRQRLCLRPEVDASGLCPCNALRLLLAAHLPALLLRNAETNVPKSSLLCAGVKLERLLEISRASPHSCSCNASCPPPASNWTAAALYGAVSFCAGLRFSGFFVILSVLLSGLRNRMSTVEKCG